MASEAGVTTSRLRLLTDIDAALASEDGLSVSRMAERHGVSIKTVRRALVLIRSQGRQTRHEPREDGTYRHRYEANSRPLFTDNLL